MSKKFHNFRVKYQESSIVCLRSFATSGSSVKSQVLDLKTLPIFSPLKVSVKCYIHKSLTSSFHTLPASFQRKKEKKGKKEALPHNMSEVRPQVAFFR